MDETSHDRGALKMALIRNTKEQKQHSFSPRCKCGTDKVVPESDIVDNIPAVGWICLPKRLSKVVHDMVDSRVSIVHQNVQLAILFALDGLKQPLDFILLSVIN